MAINFDKDKNFSENLSSFLEETKEIDSDMAEILIKHSAELANIVSDGDRDYRTRTKFNSLVKRSLEDLLNDTSEEGPDEWYVCT